MIDAKLKISKCNTGLYIWKFRKLKLDNNRWGLYHNCLNYSIYSERFLAYAICIAKNAEKKMTKISEWIHSGGLPHFLTSSGLKLFCYVEQICNNCLTDSPQNSLARSVFRFTVGFTLTSCCPRLNRNLNNLEFSE